MTLPLDPPAELSPAAPEGGEGRATGSVWRLILDVFLRNRLAVAGLAIIVLMAMFSFIGPLLYKTDQLDPNLLSVNLGPGGGHPLEIGRASCRERV